MAYPTLKASNNEISAVDYQVNVLEKRLIKNIRFKDKLKEIGLFPLRPFEMSIFQINIGKMCNQTCRHCHVDAGPDRTEIMNRETMMECLTAIKDSPFTTVDLTGGAPELNPDFRWFVEEIKKLDKEIIVRSNLTIINERKEFADLPYFFKKHNIIVISSLPCYTEENVNSQRGEGVFERSINALKELNRVGYGQNGSGLELHLVFNPGGTALPGSQMGLQNDYKKSLWADHKIVFNNLYTLTNIPINRFLYFLLKDGKYEEYMEKLIQKFNPSAAMGVMCRNTISIGWNGYIYDCDFNQQLELSVEGNAPQHVRDFSFSRLEDRNIVIGQHCFGCTAGEGSSCQGALDI